LLFVTQRIQLGQRSSEPYQQLLRLHSLVEKAAAGAGLDQRLIELVKIRGSMLNGCSFCLDLHTRTARRLGETERHIYLLRAWKETDIHRPGACRAGAHRRDDPAAGDPGRP
jgi:AhpD family alkylhydroperoxidase